MNRAPADIVTYYNYTLGMHPYTGLVAKVCLLCALILVAQGNRKPGHQLLAAVFAFQFLSVGYLALGGAGALAVAAGSLVGACCAGFVALRPEGAWRILPATGWQRWAALAGYLWAFWYPVWSRHGGMEGALRSIFFSPMAVLPGPTIVAGLTLALASWPNTPRLFAWGMVSSAVIIGGAELFAGAHSSLVPLAAAGGLASLLLRAGVAAGPLEDERPPVDEAARERELARLRQVLERDKPPTDGGGGTRTWNIK